MKVTVYVRTSEHPSVAPMKVEFKETGSADDPFVMMPERVLLVPEDLVTAPTVRCRGTRIPLERVLYWVIE